MRTAGLAEVLLPSAAKWFTVFIKTGKDSNLSRVFACGNDTVAWDDVTITGQVSLNGFLV